MTPPRSLLTWLIFVLKNAYDQTLPPAPTFGPDEMEDMSGKVVLVTGGNTGIGYEICLALLRKNAKVYMASRSRSKAETAISQLSNLVPGSSCHYISLDLSDLSSVKRAAGEFEKREERLDVLFCNAGVMVPDMKDLTRQGYDLQFGTNVLGHHYLIRLLTPNLTKPSQDQPKQKSRIVLLSSIGHTLFPPHFENAFEPSITIPGSKRDKVGKFGLYGHSKMGNILTAKYFDKILGDRVVVTACHPGVITTELYRTTPSIGTWFMSPVSKPPSYGALSPLYLGCFPETEGKGGRYFVPWGREVAGSLDPRLRDGEWEEQAERLNKWVDEQVGEWEQSGK